MDRRESATWVAAVVLQRGRGRVVSFITLVEDEECAAHELKLDVVCSFAAHRHLGRALMRYVTAFARLRRGKSVLVLFATPSARPIWIRNWGFRERSVVCDPVTGQCSYGRWIQVNCSGHGTDETCHCHRLTKIIKDEDL